MDLVVLLVKKRSVVLEILVLAHQEKIIKNIYSGGILSIKNYNYNDRIKLPELEYPIPFNQRAKKIIKHKMPNQMLRVIKKFRKRPKYEDIDFFRESPINEYLIDDYSKKIILNTDMNILSSAIRKKYDFYYRFALNNDLKPVFEKLNEGSVPWCLPVFTKNHSESLKWFKWGWDNDLNIFSWPTLPQEILIKNNNELSIWKKLICFEL